MTKKLVLTLKSAMMTMESRLMLLRKDPRIKMLLEVQEALENISEENIEQVVNLLENIISLNENNKKIISDQIFLFLKAHKMQSAFYEYLIRYFNFECINELAKKRPNYDQIFKFKYLKDNIRIKANYLKKSIISDDIDSFQRIIVEMNSSPKEIFIEITEYVIYPLLLYICLNGAFKCFKYIFLNTASIDFLDHCFQFAVAGGNIEIIRILELEGFGTKKCKLTRLIKTTAIFHHSDVFNWLFELYSYVNNEIPEKLILSLLKTGNLHVLDVIPKISQKNLVKNIKERIPIISEILMEIERRKSEFAIACQECNVNIVKKYIENEEFNINKTFFICEKVKFKSGLSVACSNGCSKVVSMLIKHPNINVNQQKDGTFPLLTACKKNNFFILKILLKSQTIDVNCRRNNITPLIYAVRYNYYKITKLLLKQSSIEVNSRYKYSELCYFRYNMINIFVEAAWNNNQKIVKLLLKHPKFSDEIEDQDYYLACLTRDVKILKKIFILFPYLSTSYIFKEIESNIFYGNEENPEIIQIFSPTRYSKKVLRINKKQNFVYSCQKGNYDVVNMYVKDKSFNINEITELKDYNYPTISKIYKCSDMKKHSFGLLEACTMGRKKVLSLLLSRKDLDVNNFYQTYPIIEACKNNHFKIVKMLISDYRIKLKPDIIVKILKILIEQSKIKVFIYLIQHRSIRKFVYKENIFGHFHPLLLFTKISQFIFLKKLIKYGNVKAMQLNYNVIRAFVNERNSYALNYIINLNIVKNIKCSADSIKHLILYAQKMGYDAIISALEKIEKMIIQKDSGITKLLRPNIKSNLPKVAR